LFRDRQRNGIGRSLTTSIVGRTTLQAEDWQEQASVAKGNSLDAAAGHVGFARRSAARLVPRSILSFVYIAHDRGISNVRRSVAVITRPEIKGIGRPWLGELPARECFVLQQRMDAAMKHGREIESAASTVAQLRSDIDRGRTGDKVNALDPAAAPLGTDKEAAGTPPSPEVVSLSRAQEKRRIARKPSERSGPITAWLLTGGIVALLLVFVFVALLPRLA
jgi:hypothetical protein